MRSQQIPLSIYLHFPWCLSKCPYCDFNSRVHPKQTKIIEQYLSTMRKDLVLESKTLTDSTRPIIAVFWGGGTPSLLSSQQIATILDTIRQQFNLDSKTEITIEANPLTIDYRKAKELLAIGINRISLGVQSFDTQTLNKLGRQYQADQATDSIKILQDAGFANLNLDLMYGLPDQSLAMAIADLSQALEFGPNHLSWYQLTLIPEKRQWWQTRGYQLPNSDLISQIEQAGRHLLIQNGMQRYEISAYAASPNQRCIHNLNYWGYGDYLGIGAGACGKITDSDNTIKRTQKTLNPIHYLKKTVESIEYIDSQKQELEFMLNIGRLLQPVPYRWLHERTTCDIKSWLVKLKKLADDGLVELHSRGFVITKRGSELLDSWLLDFA